MSKVTSNQLLFGSDTPLNVELFAGGGGVSAGAKKIGIYYDIAINHNTVALAIHKANFPHAIQMINDVFEYSPLLISRGSRIGRLHLSPDCTYHTRAKGTALDRHDICGDDCSVDHSQLTTENADRIRGLGWVGVGYAASVRPDLITLENVEEYINWSPTIVNAKGEVVADTTKKGQTFEAFLGVLTTGIRKNHPALKEIRAFLKPFLGSYYNEKALIKGLGYKVEYKVLTASDYGAPTSRTRLFMIMRCDGIPIKWPEPTHGDPQSDEVKSGKLEPWRTAGECIDWSVPAPSIFQSKEKIKRELGITAKRPLAPKTMQRIARGIEKFVLDTDNPYLVKFSHGHAEHIKAPYVANFKGTNIKTMPIGNKASEPLTTITTVDSHALISASVGELEASFVAKFRGQEFGYSNNEPVHTITAGGIHFASIRAKLAPSDTVSAAHILKFYGNEKDGHSAHHPLHTITTKERFGLIESKTSQAMDDEKRYNAWWVARMLEEFGSRKEPCIGGTPLPRESAVTLRNGLAVYDVGMRMFTVKELFKAQGFEDDFVFDPMVEVKQKNGKIITRKATKTEAVKMVGNSVPPQFATAILKAQLEAEADYYDTMNAMSA